MVFREKIGELGVGRSGPSNISLQLILALMIGAVSQRTRLPTGNVFGQIKGSSGRILMRAVMHGHKVLEVPKASNVAANITVSANKNVESMGIYTRISPRRLDKCSRIPGKEMVLNRAQFWARYPVDVATKLYPSRNKTHKNMQAERRIKQRGHLH